jgi:aryl carrier-like protein
MLPSRLVVLEALPRTPSGKVDARALPTPSAPGGDGEPPRTAAERALAALWAELLGRPAIHRDAHFFELGGDSISALRLVARAREAGLALSVRQIFESPRLSALALAVEVTGAPLPAMPASAPVGPSEAEDRYPLSPVQEGMLFHALVAGSDSYHQQVIARLEGSLDRDALRRAWQGLVDRHPVLRTSFAWRGDGPPVQEVRRRVEVPFQVLDWSHLDEAVADIAPGASIRRARRSSA